MNLFNEMIEKYLNWSGLPRVRGTDVLEILILSYLTFCILVWIKRTRAWTLLRGMLVLFIFLFFVVILQLNTIIWIVTKCLNAGIIAGVIVFQPELRRALEQLGRKDYIGAIFKVDETNHQDYLADRTIQEIIRATFNMAKNKTGALIVLEQSIALTEYERTGITIDSTVSSQLLMNIFEHNTPLHDGAVIIRNNRIASATCYLPLSDSMTIAKELGTRHRAAIGVSEVSDSITIIVSEETGAVSVAQEGHIYRNVDADILRSFLVSKEEDGVKETKRFMFWKGRKK